MNALSRAVNNKYNKGRLLSTVFQKLQSVINNIDSSSGPGLMIPGDSTPLIGEEPDVRLFYNEFRDFMRQLRLVSVVLNRNIKPFVDQSLEDCTHV